MPWKASLITAGGSLVSSLASNVINTTNTTAQFRRQKELMDIQNRYNSPSNQMRLLADAGLNPNMIYSGNNPVISAAGGNAPPSQPATAPDFSQAIQNYYSAKTAEAQIKVMEAQKENIDADTDNKKVNTDTSDFELTQLKRNADNVFRSGELQNQQIEANIRSVNANTDIANLTKQEKQKWYESIDKAIQLHFAREEAELRNSLSSLSINWYNAKTSRISANASMLNAQTQKELKNITVEKVKADTQQTLYNIEREKRFEPAEKQLLIKNVKIAEQAIIKAKKENDIMLQQHYMNMANQSLDLVKKVYETQGIALDNVGSALSLGLFGRRK